jgi:hypothetical protein
MRGKLAEAQADAISFCCPPKNWLKTEGKPLEKKLISTSFAFQAE